MDLELLLRQAKKNLSVGDIDNVHVAEMLLGEVISYNSPFTVDALVLRARAYQRLGCGDQMRKDCRSRELGSN